MPLNILSKKDSEELYEIAKVKHLSNLQAKFLEKQLRKFKYEYYNNDTSLITDDLYDALEKKLKHYLTTKDNSQTSENNSTDLFSSNTLNVVEEVGAELESRFTKIEHSIPMLSLDNAFNKNDVEDFDVKIKKFLNLVKSRSGTNDEDNSEKGETEVSDIVYHAEPKIDGLSLSIIYKLGKFTRAVTRGNGIIGEDVSINAQNIKNIPHSLKGDYPQLLEIRGEVFISKENFKLLNQQQKESNGKIFATARNAASGSLRLLDTNMSSKRYLEFLPWGFGNSSPNYIKKLLNLDLVFKNLESFGFTVNRYNRVCTGVQSLLKYYAVLDKERSNIPYEIDGTVYKVNSIALQDRLGFLIKSPRWAIAHKFVAITVKTKVNNIVIQIGRTGVLTPVAELEPVGIGGVVVSRVTLHNFDEVERKDIQIGDTVELYRAGDVIPKINKVVLEERTNTKKVVIPSKCPYCDSKVEHIEGEVAIRCSATVWFCSGRRLENLKHFVSKNAMNIEGLSEQTIKFLLDNNYIAEYADIYKLKRYYELLKEARGFGEQSINKLLLSIENSKNIHLSNLIFALGIPQVGFKHAKTLSKHYKNMTNFLNAFITLNTNENLVSQINIQFFGESIIESIYNYCKNQEQQEVLNKLLPILKITNNSTTVLQSSNLSEKRVLFSGTLQTLSRPEAQTLAEKHGAYIVSSISKSLDYLIIGEKAGSKLKKAQELGVKILSEEEFLNLIKAL